MTFARAACALASMTALACTDPPTIAVLLDPPGVDAARIAVNEVNAGGGVGGRRLVLRILEDSAGKGDDPQRVAEDGAVLAVVLGTPDPTNVRRWSRVLSQKGVPHVVAIPAAPAGAGREGAAFHAVPGPEGVAERLAAEARAGARTALVATVVEEDLRVALRRLLEAAGRAPVVDLSYREVEFDTLAALAGAVAAAEPNLVFWLGQRPELDEILPRLRGLLPRAEVIAGNVAEAPGLYRGAGVHFSGVRFVRFTDPMLREGKVLDFRLRYLTWTGGREPTGRALVAYDAVGVIADAMRSGGLERAGIRAQLAQVGRGRPAFPGIGGPIGFDAEGQSGRPVLLGEVTFKGVLPAEERGPPPADTSAVR